MKVPVVFQLLHEIYGTFTLGLSLFLLVVEAIPKREFIAVLISQKFLLFSWIRETPRRLLSESVISQTSSALKIFMLTLGFQVGPHTRIHKKLIIEVIYL